MIMAKYGLLVGICAFFTVLICLIKFPVIFLGIWSGWKKCDRVSRLLSRSVCKRNMRAQTPQSQNVIFLLNVDNIFGPCQRVTYLLTTAVKRLNRYFCFLLLGFHLPVREKWAKMYKSVSQHNYLSIFRKILSFFRWKRFALKENHAWKWRRW